ncbi:MAG TPA: TIGR02757 family protein [Bacteroidia bacterium]|jgi:uncharacterized protein (TIGR02757 family)|nr:TIGR02757 family protein [Bacteroidia bacterium]
MKLAEKDLKSFLEEKYELYNRPSFIEPDPVSIPHQFTRKEDIEIAAFIAATIAWGQRPTILKNANRLMELMDNEPYQFIIESEKKDWKRFEGFVHRTFQYADVIYFIQSLQNIYLNYGGLEKVFAEKGKKDIKNGIAHFRKIFLEINPAGRTAKHISNVEKNASAKRINMFLRWMVRNDKRGVDFGIWKSLSPTLLYCPLDLHSGRVARKLGLLGRTQDDWKAVHELTMNLRSLDKKDPVKYDFALFGLGVFERF